MFFLGFSALYFFHLKKNKKLHPCKKQNQKDVHSALPAYLRQKKTREAILHKNAYIMLQALPVRFALKS